MGWAPSVMAGPLATSLRGLWVSGLLPPHTGGPSSRAATRKPTRRGRLGRGIRRESFLTAKNKRYSRISVVCINALRRGGTRRPWSELQSSARELSPAACSSRVPISFVAISVSLQPEFHFFCPCRDCIMRIFLDAGTPCDCRAPPMNDVG